MSAVSASRSTLRLAKELRELQQSSDLSIAAVSRDDNVTHIRALIIGTPDTPYEFGFFEFDLLFPNDYPTKPPHVQALTTDNGNVRFNPNIYAAGKVCLSILGTWSAKSGEEWSTVQGLESTLISIQSLMSSNPYENEPGHEDEDPDSVPAKNYVAKLRHETLRVSIIDRLEIALGLKPQQYSGRPPRAHDFQDDGPDNGIKSPASIEPQGDGDEGDESDDDNVDEDDETSLPASKKTKLSDGTSVATKQDSAESSAVDGKSQFDPFVDLCKRRFLWYYACYLATIDREAKLHKRGKAFVLCRFEYTGNRTMGTFDYENLRNRMQRLRSEIDKETSTWAPEGLNGSGPISSIRTSLHNRFDQAKHAAAKDTLGSRFDVTLVGENPFVWNITLFGKPSTQLEGSVIHICMYFPPKYPDHQPRVSVTTPLFHHRISPHGGVLCYITEDASNPISHLVGIFSALEEEDSTYDPRTLVHPEASELLWGSESSKKMYRRRVRRSAQTSVELS